MSVVFLTTESVNKDMKSKKKKKKKFKTVIVIVYWNFSMFCQMFFSSQLKRSVIISNKHGKYELPYELPNILGN